jgi:hypothetical protein
MGTAGAVQIQIIASAFDPINFFSLQKIKALTGFYDYTIGCEGETATFKQPQK